jgi:hypothetical protein
VYCSMQASTSGREHAMHAMSHRGQLTHDPINLLMEQVRISVTTGILNSAYIGSLKGQVTCQTAHGQTGMMGGLAKSRQQHCQRLRSAQIAKTPSRRGSLVTNAQECLAHMQAPAILVLRRLCRLRRLPSRGPCWLRSPHSCQLPCLALLHIWSSTMM